MIYYEIVFEYGGPVSEGYQELNDSGTEVTRLTDLSGNTLIIEGPYGYRFKYSPARKVTPSWA
jgi:hypothetical protein